MLAHLNRNPSAIGQAGSTLLTTICERPATADELRVRLRASLDERRARKKLPFGPYGISVSDRWLEEQISELQHAFQRAGGVLEAQDLD